jgi:hypothetical protein
VPSFELAAEARQVYEIIRGAQRAAKMHSEPDAADVTMNVKPRLPDEGRVNG